MPVTARCMYHRFGDDHRCVRCNRWAPGWAPKRAPVRPRHECQVCERTQAVAVGGTMVNHGYRRPGWGAIVGNCPGVGHQPFPATDALESYLTALLDEAQRLAARQLALVEGADWLDFEPGTLASQGTSFTPAVVAYGANYRAWMAGNGETHTEGLTESGLAWYRNVAINRVNRNIEYTDREIRRVQVRISKGAHLRAQEVTHAAS